MSTTIDINVTPTIQDVTINTVDNITVINVNTQSGGGGIESIVAGTNITVDNTDPLNPIINSTGGGGSQTLAQTLVQGNTTDGQNISISEGDAVVLNNGSKLQKGTTDAGLGGNKGIALKCSLDYEFKWEAGRLYIMEQGGTTIRAVLNNFTNIPINTDDQTKGYVVGSTWVLDNGDIYVCTDRTVDNAVWVQKGGIGDVLDINQNAIDKLINFISTDENGSNIVDFNGSTIERFIGGGVNLLYQNLSYADYNIITAFDGAGSFVNSIQRNHHSERYTKGSFSTSVTYDNPTGNGVIKFPNVANATKTVAMTSDIPTIDATPTDGSANAVSSNGVFDALATKENTITAGTTSQYYRGDKTFQTLDKTAVGLGNVDNTSDANKPISTATQTALNAKQDNLFEFNTRQGFYIFDDFIGNPASSTFTSYGISTGVSGAGATCLPNTTYPNRTNQQGVMQLGTGTTATGSSIVRVGDNNAGAHYLGNGVYTMQFFANIETLSDATNRFFNFFGATATNNLTSTNVIAFIYDEGTAIYGASSPNWKCVTRVGTTATLTTTTVPIVAGQWFVLRIVVNANASSVEFFINNVSVATHTTNIPTLITPRAAMAKTVGTTNRNAFLDYMLVQQIYTTPR